MHPLGRSASELREGMQAPGPRRPWELAITSGIEYDSNPMLVGSGVPIGEEDDFRAVMRLQASYRYDSEHFRLSAGYDGYGSVHEDLGEVDLFTNVGWAAGSVRIEPVRLNLRYDFAYTKLDLNQKYQRVHRITPSITVTESRWGLSELFYQYQDIDYFFDNRLPISTATESRTPSESTSSSSSRTRSSTCASARSTTTTIPRETSSATTATSSLPASACSFPGRWSSPPPTDSSAGASGTTPSSSGRRDRHSDATTESTRSKWNCRDRSASSSRSRCWPGRRTTTQRRSLRLRPRHRRQLHHLSVLIWGEKGREK